MMEEVKTSHDGRMDDPATSSTKMETMKDVAVWEPSAKSEMQEDFVVKEQGVSVDTTDKRNRQNTFAAKKTVAQGMMDVALITANANQLRYLLTYQKDSPTFYLTLSMIIVSLVLQIAVGVSLIFKGRYDIKGKSKSVNAERINNYVVVAVFLITIVNVFIAAFSVSTPEPQPLQVPTPRNSL